MRSRASCSVAAIWSSSSVVMVCPVLQVFAERVRSYFSLDVLVIYNGWRQPAGSNATGGHQRHSAVGGGCAWLDLQVVLGGFKKLRPAFDVAGGAQANHAGMLTCWLECEEVIKRRHPIGAAQRHPQRYGHVAQSLFVQVSEALLYRMQGFDQSA